jgi:hypothetical protein
LFRSLRSGEIANKRRLRFSFPTFWHYDVLQDSTIYEMQESNPAASVKAVKAVIDRRHQNRCWPLNLLHPETTPLEMGDPCQSKPLEHAARSPAFCGGTANSMGQLRIEPARVTTWVKKFAKSPFGWITGN